MTEFPWMLWRAGIAAGHDAASWIGSILGFLAYPRGPIGELIIAYGDIAVLVAGIGVAIFAISYGGFFNWRKTQAGRALFQFTLALTAVLVLVILARLVSQEYPFRWLARDIIYTWLAVSSIRLVAELWRNWRSGEPRLLDIESKPRREGAIPVTHVDPTSVPDIWFKTQRVLRTIVQALIVLVPIVNGVAAVTFAYLNEQTDIIVPGWAFIILNATIAATAVVMGLIARVMAVPGVNEWLTKIGLGSVPKKIIDGRDTGTITSLS